MFPLCLLRVFTMTPTTRTWHWMIHTLVSSRSKLKRLFRYAIIFYLIQFYSSFCLPLFCGHGPTMWLKKKCLISDITELLLWQVLPNSTWCRRGKHLNALKSPEQKLLKFLLKMNLRQRSSCISSFFWSFISRYQSAYSRQYVRFLEYF